MCARARVCALCGLISVREVRARLYFSFGVRGRQAQFFIYFVGIFLDGENKRRGGARRDDFWKQREREREGWNTCASCKTYRQTGVVTASGVDRLVRGPVVHPLIVMGDVAHLRTFLGAKGKSRCVFVSHRGKMGREGRGRLLSHPSSYAKAREGYGCACVRVCVCEPRHPSWSSAWCDDNARLSRPPCVWRPLGEEVHTPVARGCFECVLRARVLLSFSGPLPF